MSVLVVERHVQTRTSSGRLVGGSRGTTGLEKWYDVRDRPDGWKECGKRKNVRNLIFELVGTVVSSVLP